MSPKKRVRKAAKKSSRAARAPKRAAVKRRADPKKVAAKRRAAAKPGAAKKRASARPAARPAARPERRAAQGGIDYTHHHMDYTSHDLESVRRFWSETLGFINATVTGRGHLTLSITPRSSIGFMPPLPGPPESWRPPGEPAIYLYVDDVDRAFAELTGRGATFDAPPENMPWGHRVARLRDPEGRRICLARKLKP